MVRMIQDETVADSAEANGDRWKPAGLVRGSGSKAPDQGSRRSGLVGRDTFRVAGFRNVSGSVDQLSKFKRPGGCSNDQVGINNRRPVVICDRPARAIGRLQPSLTR